MELSALQHPDELIDNLSPLDCFHSSDQRAVEGFQQNAIEATKALIVHSVIASMVKDPQLRDDLSKSIASLKVVQP